MKTFWKNPALRASVIVLMTLLVYLPAMQAGFIWDDDVFLTQNPLIKAEDGLYRFWFTTEPPDYFPLTSSILWMEWRLWGMNATGYHVVNVVLHALSSVLIWLVLRRLKIPGAWLAALIFAVHPVNVQSVAWITERKNTQPMVFYLLTILLYLKFESADTRRWYFFALCSFLLALLSKTSVVMLPLVLIGCVWWQRRSVVPKDLVRVIPFFVLSAVLGLVTVWFQYNVAIAEDIVRTDSFLSRLAIAGQAVWFYLYKAIIPHKLSFVYPRWETDSYGFSSFLPLLALLGCLVLFWWHRKGWGKPFLLALGYYAVTLLPVIGFLNIYFMKYSLVADHWQYTSIVGIIALTAGLWAWLSNRWEGVLRIVATAMAVVLVGLFSVLTWKQGLIYADEEILWRDTISKNPAACIAHNNLGIVMAHQGRLKEAIIHYSETLRIKPDYAKAHNNLGTALAKQGRLEIAISHFSEALQIKPNYAKAHNNIGITLADQGRFEKAMSHFSEALRINPSFASAHYNMGNALVKQGSLKEAIKHYSGALRINPNYPDAQYKLEHTLWLVNSSHRPRENLVRP